MTRLRRAVALISLVTIPVALAACSSHHHVRRARLASPVIEETFTPLDCPAGRAARQTTLGSEGCLEKAILRTDHDIDSRVRAIFRLLHDRIGKKRFVAAERGWLAYRRRTCESEADVYRGGSASPVAFAACVLDHNRTHLRELAAFLQLLEHR